MKKSQQKGKPPVFIVGENHGDPASLLTTTLMLDAAKRHNIHVYIERDQNILVNGQGAKFIKDSRAEIEGLINTAPEIPAHLQSYLRRAAWIAAAAIAERDRKFPSDDNGYYTRIMAEAMGIKLLAGDPNFTFSNDHAQREADMLKSILAETRPSLRIHGAGHVPFFCDENMAKIAQRHTPSCYDLLTNSDYKTTPDFERQRAEQLQAKPQNYTRLQPPTIPATRTEALKTAFDYSLKHDIKDGLISKDDAAKVRKFIQNCIELIDAKKSKGR